MTSPGFPPVWPLAGRPLAVIGVDPGKMPMAFGPMLSGFRRSATLRGTSSMWVRCSVTRRLT